MLNGFFDGTAAPDGDRFYGVAGYLFEEAGLINFRNGYASIKDAYKRDFNLDIGVFHSTDCCGKRGFGRYEGWMPELRHRLCREVAQLTAKCRLAGFFASVPHNDIEKASPFVLNGTGGAYTLVLTECMEYAAEFAKARNEKIFYWMEAGDPKQESADVMLNKIRDSRSKSETFAYFSHAIVPKGHDEAIALVSADALAWECKRNFSELNRLVRADAYHDDEKLTDNFKTLRGDDPRRWFEIHTFGHGLGVRALINEIAGIAPR